MSYKLDGESIAPEVFTFAGPAVPQRKTKSLKNNKNKKKAVVPSSATETSQPSQSPQPSQLSQSPRPFASSAGASAPEPNFWEKPPAFCDISIKDALAPIKRNGKEVETPFTAEQVLRAAAGEIEHFNNDEDRIENYGWYLGKEEADRKRKAAEKAKYKGKTKGKGKGKGKVVSLSQLRLAASGMSSFPQTGPFCLAAVPTMNSGENLVGGERAQLSQISVPADTGSQTRSEYHEADCDCGCVSASEFEAEQAAILADAAARVSSKYSRATYSDSDTRIPNASNKGKKVARGTTSDSSTLLSMLAPPRESEDEYYGSDCGCEGEYCDSDCDFYPSDFYASDVYFEVERPATPGESGSPTAPSLASISSPLSFSSTLSEPSSSSSIVDVTDLMTRPEARLRPSKVTSKAVPTLEGINEFEYMNLGARSQIIPAAASRTARQQADTTKHSPPAKRCRPGTSLTPSLAERNQHERSSDAMTLGQLAFKAAVKTSRNSYDCAHPPAYFPTTDSEALTSRRHNVDSERIRRDRMVEMERQRQFLRTLVADLPRMQQETAAIVAASFPSTPTNPYLQSLPDSPPAPFPTSSDFHADDSVLVVRRPSLPTSDFEFDDDMVVEDYNSDTDPWTFIQQATARDIVRVERAGAEPSIDMLIRLQKSSRREAFGLWREKLRTRQAARATLPAARTALPSRPLSRQRTTCDPRKFGTAAHASPAAPAATPLPEVSQASKERTAAMKLQLEAVLGAPAPAPRSAASLQVSAKIESAITLSLQVEAELKAAAQQPTDKRTLEALALRHSTALSAMAASYSAQSAELEEQEFAEVRELALAARASGSFRPLTRAPVTASHPSRAARPARTRTAEQEADTQAAALDIRAQVAELEAQAFAEVRELALARIARAAARASQLSTCSAPPPASASSAPTQANNSSSQLPPPLATHPDSTPFLTMTPLGPRNLGFRTPEHIFNLGWKGWTNLTPEEAAREEVERLRRTRWNHGPNCPLSHHLKSRDVSSRTSFVCLLCADPHLASF